MGTRAHVIVTAPDLELAELLGRAAITRLHTLEAKWSRFRPDSEISALNRADGASVVVSSETVELVARSVEAWHRTDGAFDPTVLPSLVAAGYDRDFGSLGADDDGSGRRARSGPAPGCGGIVIDGARVTLPAGVALDGGGIGKGLAADTVVDLVMSAGATGACVNVGGDLRVAGTAPGSDPWSVTVEHPLGGPTLGTIDLHDEALVSSWRTRRTWGASGRPSPPSHRPGDRAAGVVGSRRRHRRRAGGVVGRGAGHRPVPRRARPRAALVDHHGISALVVRDDGAVRAFGRLCPAVTAAR